MIDLLLVDDDENFRQMLVERFKSRNFRVFDAPNGQAAWQLAERHEFDVAVFDMVVPGMSGLELLKKFKERGCECEVILLTAQASVPSAVEAMKTGAYDYLTKPFPLGDLEKCIEKASRQRALAKENSQLKALLNRRGPQRPMIGNSSSVQEVFRLIERAGPSGKPILIQGESGTGKELVAGSLHEHSDRADKPIVVINCAALSESLLESELFGHEKGSFTGATTAKPGLFEVADGGTLFIDELGEMPVAVQVKLLRILEDGSIRRVGSTRERHVDVRLLAATNRNLEKQVEYGRFREDLYYRINVLSIELPPLRERKGDVPLLVNHFLGAVWKIEAEAMKLLEAYHWPGNIRQLNNVIERAKILADDGVIRCRDLPANVAKGTTTERPASFAESGELGTMERAKLIEVLQRVGGNKTRAAQLLGIERRKLYRLLEKHGILDRDLTERAN